jgi:hypothetical protein
MGGKREGRGGDNLTMYSVVHHICAECWIWRKWRRWWWLRAYLSPCKQTFKVVRGPMEAALLCNLIPLPPTSTPIVSLLPTLIYLLN